MTDNVNSESILTFTYVRYVKVRFLLKFEPGSPNFPVYEIRES